MSRRPSSTKVRRDCFDANKWTDGAGKVWLDCHICGLKLDPVRDPWEAEHVVPHANGGTDVRPAHVACHKPKTAKDVSEIAKGKRVHDFHFGIKRRGSSFQTNRNGKFKKKLDGSVVER